MTVVAVAALAAALADPGTLAAVLLYFIQRCAALLRPEAFR